MITYEQMVQLKVIAADRDTALGLVDGHHAFGVIKEVTPEYVKLENSYNITYFTLDQIRSVQIRKD